MDLPQKNTKHPNYDAMRWCACDGGWGGHGGGGR